MGTPMQLQEMQTEINQLLKSLNVDTPLVFAIDNRKNIASALGFYVNGTIPLLNQKVNSTLGFVSVDVDYLNRNLTYDEQKFVLAHETSHIFLNHVVPIAIDTLVDRLIKYYDPDLHKIVNIVKIFLYLFGVPPPLPFLIKEQELAADVRAIFLTGNENAAKTCLTKLVGGNLDSCSHTWEALGIKMPVMTMRERLQGIQQKLAEYRQFGYKITF